MTSSFFTQIGSDIDGEAAYDYSGSSVSLSADGSVVAIGATQNDGNGSDSGHVRIYKNVNDNWTQVGSDIDGEAAEDSSGISVSLSQDGTIVAIGATGNDGNGMRSGHVRIYKNVNDNWTKIGNDIDGEAEFDHFGTSVSLSSDGSVVAIGASGNDGNGTDSGHVRIYKNVNNSWLQIGEDIDGEHNGDGSGESVSLSADGSIVAIGAQLNSDNGTVSGHVRIYKNVNDNWTKIGNDIDGEAESDYSGRAISLSSDGETVAIGATGNDGNGMRSGHVRIYKNVNDNWTKIGNDIDGEAEFDHFGTSVSLSSDGSVVAIGAPNNAANGYGSGHVQIYKNVNDNWTKIGTDIDGEAINDGLGSSVSFSADGSFVAISAQYNDGNGSISGHVRIYRVGITDFEALNYIASYGDLINAFGIDIEAAKSHYTNFGISESRSLSLFSATNYLAKYSDLSAAFGSDQTLALKHYIQYGYSEGRTDPQQYTVEFDGTGTTTRGAYTEELTERKTFNIFRAWNSDISPDKYGLYWTHDIYDELPGKFSLETPNWNYQYVEESYDDYPGIAQFVREGVDWGHDSKYGKTLATDYTNPAFHDYFADLVANLNSDVDGIMLDWWHDHHYEINSESEVAEAREQIAQHIREKMGDDFLLVGNVGWDKDTATIDYLNGVFLELWKPHFNAYTSIEIDTMVDILNYYENELLYPKLIAYEPWRVTNQAKPRTEDRLTPENERFAKLFATILNVHTSNGYYLYPDSNFEDTYEGVFEGTLSDHRHAWYSFYDIDIGKPTSKGVQVANRIGVRRYEKGLLGYNYTSKDVEIITPNGLIKIPSESGAILYLTESQGLNYIASYGDLINAFGNDTEAAKSHYINHGYSEGRALDTFDEWGYLASNNDLMNAFGSDTTEAVKHYISYGNSEGRVTNSFDAQSYLNNYADLKTAFGSDQTLALKHYVEYGFSEGRTDTSSSSVSGSGSSSNLTDFEALNYIASYGDLINAFGNDIDAAKSHYINHGNAEGRALDTFDEWGYLASNTDLMRAFGNDTTEAVKHYISYGKSEGRSTNIFNADSYLNNYADLKSAFGNDHTLATKHYVESGFNEGRIF